MRTPIVRTARDESVSQTVVMAVAEATDADPLTLDPRLCEVIDPDALERLFERDQTEVQVEFTMADCRVSVRADGSVVVLPPEEDRSFGIECEADD